MNNFLSLKDLTIAVDFDGTCVTHDCPRIGRDVGAVPVLKDLISAGARLILWTCRSGKTLDDAVAWFSDRGIPLYGVNCNPEQKTWSNSPKALADIYIDDRGISTPMLPGQDGEHPYVDWDRIRKLLLPDMDLSLSQFIPTSLAG